MSASVERRLDEKARRREEIVDAAESLALELGWDQVTVGSVAKKARLSRALVYLYFKGKDSLHAALSERAQDALYARFRQAADSHQGLNRIQAIGMEYIRFAKECPHYVEAITHFEASPIDEEENPAIKHSSRNKVHGLIVRILEQEIARGSVRSDLGDLHLISLNLWAFTHGLIQISSSRRKELERDGIDEQSLALSAMNLMQHMLRAG